MKRTLIALIFVFGIFGMFQFAQAQEAAKAEEPVKAVEEPPAIELKMMEPFSYCCLEMTGSYEQHSTAFMALYGAVGSQAINPEGEPFGVYWNDPESTPVDQLKWEIGVPVTEGVEIKEPLKLKTWNFTNVVSKMYEGPFDEAGTAYKEMTDWIGMNGYVCAGPPMEKFLGMPVQNEKGQWAGKIEIVLPVQKAE